MINLYKVISELSDSDFQELLSSFAETKADKSSGFLQIIRTNPNNPEKVFLTKFDISEATFYVLKSRLNQKVEEFLMRKIGGKDIDLVGRTYKASEKIFETPRQSLLSGLNQLERELLRLDFPYGLVTVYKLLQNLHLFDQGEYTHYQAQYKKQVAYTLAIDTANDHLMNFFKIFDNYLLSRREEDYQNLLKYIERLEVVSNMYDSHRLYIYKSIAQLFGIIFLDIQEEYKGNLDSIVVIFDKVFDILNANADDGLYKQLHLLFNFLRHAHLEKNQPEKAQRYFEILDNKTEELLENYHLNAPTALFLTSKLSHHIKNQTLAKLKNETESELSALNIDTYRPAHYIYYHFFLAKVYFLNRDFGKSNRILFSLRNIISFRKYTHADLEIRLLMVISYIQTNEMELSDTLFRSIQRQLRDEPKGNYESAKILAKIITVVSGQRLNTRRRNLLELIPEFKRLNTGKHKVLEFIDLEDLFLDA